MTYDGMPDHLFIDAMFRLATMYDPPIKLGYRMNRKQYAIALAIGEHAILFAPSAIQRIMVGKWVEKTLPLFKPIETIGIV